MSGAVDLDDDSLTENTRASYPLHFIPNASDSGIAGHPRHIVMLTADAFGVLPPISRLTPEQAMYHFLSGYTARVGGTEAGRQGAAGDLLGLLRRAVPAAQAQRLCQYAGRADAPSSGRLLAGQHRLERRALWHGRAHVPAAHPRHAAGRAGRRARGVAMREHPQLGLAMPTSCPGVPDEVLDPRATWADGAAYDAGGARGGRTLPGRISASSRAMSAPTSGRGDPRLSLPGHLAQRLLDT